MTDLTSVYGLRDALLRLADLYETVASLEHVRDPMRAVPGPRVPPGAQDVLDADEVTRALTGVDTWAEFWSHVLVDERGARAPYSTPARLRVIATYSSHFHDSPDYLTAAEFGPCGELDDLLRTMGRIARQAERVIRTGHRCQESDCGGQLVSSLGSGDGRDAHDPALVCTRDSRHVVAWSVWSSWPRMRVQYITVEHAMRMRGLPSIAATWQRAKRESWRRQGTGRDVRYYVPDVQGHGGDDDTATDDVPA